MSKKTKKEFIDEVAANAIKYAKNYDDLAQITREMVGPLIEKFLQAELDGHLGYEKHDSKGYNSGNNRNGSYDKDLMTSTGKVKIKVPRDRNGDYEPEIIEKYQSRTGNFDQKIINMYGLGLTTSDIQKHIVEIYGASISPSQISAITDKVVPEIKQWQSRPLESCYPIVYFDAIHHKVKDNGKYVNKATYIALGIGISGIKEIIGLYIGQAESSSFWQSVCNDLSNRGVEDILLACIDGLTGFADAIRNVFPEVEIQRCVIHQIRHSLRYVASKDTKEFVKDLKAIYQADNLELAEQALSALELKRSKIYSISVSTWRNNWGDLSTYFVYPRNIRKLIYTTNTIEAFNRQLRKVTKTTTVFSTETALLKQLYLATLNAQKKRQKQVHNWGAILGQFESFFPGRVTKYLN